jgi:hypothetical protein
MNLAAFALGALAAMVVIAAAVALAARWAWRTWERVGRDFLWR